jgi:hypothetical protein
MFSHGKSMSRAPIMSGSTKVTKAANQNGGDGKEDHDRRMHGEKHVVGIRRNDSVA